MLRLLAMLLLFAGPAMAADKVAFGLDWKAEAEYGGYYQAVATGIYAKHGLDVSIRQGGPPANQSQLMGDISCKPGSATPTAKSGPTPSTSRRSWPTRPPSSRVI